MTDAFGHCFLPGSAEVHPDVRAAMAGHREEAGRALDQLRQPLKDLFRTSRDVFLTPSSAAGMMEAAVRNGVEERVLAVIGGSDGERFARVAEACGKEVVRAMVPPGRTLEADHLIQFLDGPEVDAVALVHSESSTGSLAHLEELARVVRSRKDVHLLVDAAGSLGGSPVETDRWQLDFVFAVCDQALALPAGLALGVASERLLARAGKQAGRGQYFDLVELARAGRPEGEGAVLPQHAALAAQLARMEAGGGIEARWTRHHEMLNLVEQWVLLHPGFAFLAPEGRRSWTVSCLRVPGGTSSSQVVAAMAERGWQIGQGTGGLRDSTIRIGHMGDLPASALSALLDTLGEVALQDSPSIV